MMAADAHQEIERRVVDENDWRLWRELRLSALADAPEAFRSSYAYWSGPGDEEENWRARLSGRPFNLVFLQDDNPAGMVSATVVDGGEVVELHSMWVAPSARGSGVGDAAIGAVVTWAREQGASSVLLSVMATNQPAAGLYRRHGFVDEGVPPGHPDERAMRLLLDR